MAHADWSPDATITSGGGLPATAVWERSTASANGYRVVAGKIAVATPAASVTGSVPLTRVVSRVAAVGRPSCASACLLLELTPELICPDPPPELLVDSEHPDSARAAPAARSRVRRGTARDDSGRFGRRRQRGS